VPSRPKRATGGFTFSLEAGAAKVRVWPRKARWGAAVRAERSNACRENMVIEGRMGCVMMDLECREASSLSVGTVVFRSGFGTLGKFVVASGSNKWKCGWDREKAWHFTKFGGHAEPDLWLQSFSSQQSCSVHFVLPVARPDRTPYVPATKRLHGSALHAITQPKIPNYHDTACLAARHQCLTTSTSPVSAE